MISAPYDLGPPEFARLEPSLPSAWLHDGADMHRGWSRYTEDLDAARAAAVASGIRRPFTLLALPPYATGRGTR
jgi:hypothetical protein